MLGISWSSLYNNIIKSILFDYFVPNVPNYTFYRNIFFFKNVYIFSKNGFKKFLHVLNIGVLLFHQNILSDCIILIEFIYKKLESDDGEIDFKYNGWQ